MSYLIDFFHKRADDVSKDVAQDDYITADFVNTYTVFIAKGNRIDGIEAK